MYGYGGNILRVSLADGSVNVSPTPRALAEGFIGGRGFAARILYDEVVRGTAVFGEHNKVVIASGPLAGLFVPAAGKITFASKSPTIGSYGDSNMGGHMAAEIKYAGFDVIIIDGISPRPVYLLIDDQRVELRSAEKIWGKGAITTEKMLKDELGHDFQVATIGPAGENRVYYACISHDFGRQAGRTGIGAVLGSKNLKAIAIRGTRGILAHDVDELIRLTKKALAEMSKHPQKQLWLEQGTASIVRWANEIGAFPTRNFRTGFFEPYENIAGDVMKREVVVTNKSCFACPMACGKYSHAVTDAYDVYVEGPEYETSALIGGNFAVSNIRDLCYANYICDELGVDTISAGNVAGFVMECVERGILSRKDVDGIEMKWGDVRSFKALMEKIAKREGIGEVLANGVRYAAQVFGKGAEKFAIQIKGLEMSGYEPREAPAMMLSYMTCDVGAHHNRSWAITHDIRVGRKKIDGKAEKVVELQHVRPMFDMLGACRLLWVDLELGLEYYPKFLKAATGFDLSLEDLLKKSEMIWNLTRCFFIREKEDFGRHYDYPPARFIEEEVPTGPTKGSKLSREDIDKLLDEYYRLRGWDENGIPKEATLRGMGLGDVADDLIALGRLPIQAPFDLPVPSAETPVSPPEEREVPLIKFPAPSVVGERPRPSRTPKRKPKVAATARPKQKVAAGKARAKKRAVPKAIPRKRISTTKPRRKMVPLREGKPLKAVRRKVTSGRARGIRSPKAHPARKPRPVLKGKTTPKVLRKRTVRKSSRRK